DLASHKTAIVAEMGFNLCSKVAKVIGVRKHLTSDNQWNPRKFCRRNGQVNALLGTNPAKKQGVIRASRKHGHGIDAILDGRKKERPLRPGRMLCRRDA